MTATQTRRRGLRPCCSGFAEHFDWCPTGQREAELRRHDLPFESCDACGGLIDVGGLIDGRRWHAGACFDGEEEDR